MGHITYLLSDTAGNTLIRIGMAACNGENEECVRRERSEKEPNEGD